MTAHDARQGRRRAHARTAARPARDRIQPSTREDVGTLTKARRGQPKADQATPTARPARRHAPRAGFIQPKADQHWRDRARCRDEDPELFFPVGQDGLARLQRADAKAVCQKCSVRRECLTWAIESGQSFGVWGGLDEDERHHLAGGAA